MADIISVIAGLSGLAVMKGASVEMISSAEKRLGLQFAEDYKAYLARYGVISARRIEITGLVDAPRLNVVEVTLAQRAERQIPPDMYVVEDTGIESILILQNGNGEIFELQGDNKPKKIYNSLADCLLSKQR